MTTPIAALSMAESNPDTVVGVVCRRRVNHTPHILHMTPGVRIEGGGDGLGQQYLTPEQVSQCMCVTRRNVHVCVSHHGVAPHISRLLETEGQTSSSWDEESSRYM